MRNFVAKAVISAFSLSLVAGCVPESNASFSENARTERCEQGGHTFDLNITVPAEYGRVHVLTQHARTSQGLVPVCPLNSGGNDRNYFYYGYSAEAFDGNAGICVSARTANAGHVMSCQSASRVRQAINAPLGTPAFSLNFTEWTEYNAY